MKHHDKATLLFALLTFGLGASSASAQQPEEKTKEQPSAPLQSEAAEAPPQKDGEEEPEITFEDLWPGGQEDPYAEGQQEIAELFAKVERRLRLIDSMLLDASAGETARLAELEGSGLDDLLNDIPDVEKPAGAGGSGGDDKACGVSGSLGHSSNQGQQVVQEIDRIIQIAQSMPSSCQSGTPQPGQKPGETPGDSPLDKPQGSREKSQSPEKPSESGTQDQPKPEGQEPKDNKDSDDPARNEPAERMPGAATETPPAVSDQREQWGDLPVHVRDVFRAEGGPGMPAQYRDWIDAYYRRLNARSGD